MYYYCYRYNYYATECNFLRGWETQKVNRIKRKNSWTWNICYENLMLSFFFNFCIIFLCHSPHPLLNPFPFISLFYFSKCTIFFPLFFSFSSSQTTPPCCSLTQTHTGTTHRLPYNFSNVYNASMAVYFCYVVFFCQYCSPILPQRNGQLFGAGVWRGAQSPHHSLSLWFWLPTRSLSIHRWRICRSLFILSKRLQRGICLCAPSGYTLSKPSNDSS